MPVDRGAIDEQLQEIGESERWWEVGEFRDLPQVLVAGERLRAIARGRMLGPRGGARMQRSRHWLFVATNERLICLQKDGHARRQIDFAAGQISVMHHGPRLRYYQVTLTTALGKFFIRLPKLDALKLAKGIEPLVPREPTRQLPPDIEPFLWIPGMQKVAAIPGVATIMAKVAMLSPPDVSPDRLTALETTIDRLQQQVEQLQQNVAFLEELLEKRSVEMVPAGPSEEASDL